MDPLNRPHPTPGPDPSLGPGYVPTVQRLRQLLTFLLVLALMPGVPELLENLEHLAQDGHLAHSFAPGDVEHTDPSDHDDDQHAEQHAALDAEHGCTPMTHHCGCHASVPVILPDDAAPIEPPAVVLLAACNPAATATAADRANAPPVPPPTA